jgi:hypothetical protein
MADMCEPLQNIVGRHVVSQSECTLTSFYSMYSLQVQYISYACIFWKFFTVCCWCMLLVVTGLDRGPSNATIVYLY